MTIVQCVERKQIACCGTRILGREIHFKMSAVKLALLFAAVCACAYSEQSNPVFPLAAKRLLKYSDIHKAIRKEVDLISSTLVESASGLTDRSQMTEQLSDVIHEKLGVMIEKLAVRSNASLSDTREKYGYCCHCQKCKSPCTLCGIPCCCFGDRCRCSPCLTGETMAFESIETLPANFDDVIKVWTVKSKDELAQTVREFFNKKIAAEGVNKSGFLEERTKLVHSVVDRVIVSLM